MVISRCKASVQETVSTGRRTYYSYRMELNVYEVMKSNQLHKHR